MSSLCDSSLVSHASEAQAREQAFRTEFNLIYTCSPLNANLPTGPVSDRHFPQSEGGLSTADSDLSTMCSQGLLMESGSSSGSLSMYLDTQFGGGYSEGGTSPTLAIHHRRRRQVLRPHQFLHLQVVCFSFSMCRMMIMCIIQYKCGNKRICLFSSYNTT